jgi:large repetitive protein
MSVAAGMDRELANAATALGLLGGDGNLDPSWFEHPLNHVGRLLKDTTQRKAFLDLVDALLPPDGNGAAPAGEHWHPLLGAGHPGNVFLTVRGDGSGPVVIGVAAAAHGPAGAGAGDLSATATASLPLLVSDGGTLHAVGGTTDGPLSFDLRIALHWTTPAQAIGLEAVRVAASLTGFDAAGPQVTLRVSLEKLDLGDGVVRDEVVLDPATIGSEAVHVVVGLLRQRLHLAAASGGLAAELATLADALIPALGLDPGTGIPPLPIDRLLTDPGSLRQWLASLTQGGGAAPVKQWLEQVAKLLAGNAVTAAGGGTADDPFRVRLLDLPAPAAGGLDVTLATVTDPATGVESIEFGASVVAEPAGPKTARVEASVVLAAVPLAGTSPARVVPRADVVVRAPGGGGRLVGVPADPFSVGSLVGGVTWDGSRATPRLDLLDVTFEGQRHDRIDLTNADSVSSAGASALTAAIEAALGASGTGHRLAALVGLVAPTGAAGWPAGSLASAVAFASNPMTEIGRVHRTVLADSGHPWAAMLSELAGLAGIGGITPGTVPGTGTPDDPWRVPFASQGALSVGLAAWNETQPPAAGQPQRLRLGIRLGAARSPWDAALLVELASFDLPSSGPAAARLLAGARVAFRASPLPAPRELAGVRVQAGSFDVGLTWAGGSSLAGGARIANLTVEDDGGTVSIPALAFPPAGAGTAANPLAGYGLTTAQSEALLGLVVRRAAAAWGGIPAQILGSLAGLFRGHVDFPQDWPTIAGGPAALLRDPTAALRDLLQRVLTTTSAAGEPFARYWLEWLQRALTGKLPAAVDGAVPPVELAGSGRRADPWAIPLRRPEGAVVEALVWLEPDGPPSSLAAPAAAAVRSSIDFAQLADRLAPLAPFVPAVAATLDGREPGAVAAGLTELAAHFAQSDGVVPVASQAPTGPGWQTGAVQLHTPHEQLPSDPGAISQILAQITSWTPAAVLLVGPAFADSTAWQPLLNAAESAQPGSTNAAAHIDFRQAGVSPTAVDFRTLTTVARFYTADLADPGAADQSAVADQIASAVARIRELHGGTGAVAVVAHSTTGVAARLHAAGAAAGTIAGLVTLGSPLLGAPIPPLTDVVVADAVRVVQRLLPGGVADARLAAALATLERALDGFTPGAAGAPPVATPFPYASFTGSVDVTLNGVPGLALVSELQVDLLHAVRDGVAALGGAVGGGTPPTHVGLGLRSDVALPGGGADGPFQVDADVRVDLARIPLTAPRGAEPPGPAHRLTARALLRRTGGWLVGDPGAETRVRQATLAVDIEPGTSGIAVTPRVVLDDASLRGQSLDTAALADAITPGLLGALLRTLTVPAASPGGAVDALLGALGALGIVVPDPHDGSGVAFDGLPALVSDPAGYLRPRVRAALERSEGLLGLSGPAGGPWALDLGGGPLELAVSSGPPRFRVRTPGDGLDLGGAKVALDVSLDLGAWKAQLDTALSWGPLRLELSQPAGRLQLSADPWLAPTALLPAGAGEGALVVLAPRLLLSAALGALLETAVGAGLVVGPIDALLVDAGNWLSGGHAFGASTPDGAPVPGFDAAKLTALLNGLAAAAALPTGPGIVLPGGVSVGATGGDPLVLAVATTAPINGVLGLSLTASIDAARHVTPGGTVSLTVPLPAGAAWPSVAVTVGTGPDGLSLAVTPSGAAAIQILPRFSGFGAFASAAAALLPSVLDRVRTELGPTPATRSQLMQLALDLCAALDVYDEAGGFSAHADAIAAVGKPGWLEGLGATVRADAAARIAALLNDPGSALHVLPGTVAVDPAGPTVDWTWTPAAATGSLGVHLGWHGTGPQVGVRATSLSLPGSPVTVGLAAGLLDGAITGDATLGIDVGTALGFPFAPALQASVESGRFALRLVPVAPLQIELAPAPQVVGGTAALETLARTWLLPLAANLAVEAAQTAAGSPLAKQLFAGGKTAEEILKAAGILDGAGNFVPALPTVPELMQGALAAISGLGVDIGADKSLNLSFVNAGGRLGVRLKGHEDIPAGGLAVSVRFGEPASWIGPDGGVTLYLLDISGSNVRLRPGLAVVGVGAALKKSGDAPLIDTSAFRLGSADAYLFFDLELDGGLTVKDVGGGIELEQVSLPLGQAAGASSSSNPVAGSLLGPGGGAGDQQHAAPTIDVIAYKRGSEFQVLIEGQPGALWIPVHQHFGPLYIDQIGVDRTADPGVELLIDGGVNIGPLVAQVDDLAVIVPFASIADPSGWRLDLKGIAVGFDTTGVKIAGGLVKVDGPPLEYDGMLVVDVVSFGFTAVGSYARPTDAQGGYTSFFVFVALPITLGGPPFLFVTGLGGGVGLNRRLLPPDDLNQIPSFLLVAAIDDGALANDPMGALLQIRGAMPPARGAFWLAAGLRFTTFVLLHSTAVVYVALDRGVDVGLLGVSRMALPTDDAAIVSVELALKARYSSSEQLFSIQAQLTDNSWLFSHDCQLTGGFAFFMWFGESQFVLTLGGYHPHFQKPDRFPDVPRLGFHWQVSDVIVVKGEAYFALTNSCVMAGGRLEATFQAGGLRAWFIAYADFLVAWDPFHYEFGIGISVGVAWHGEVCFFFCATIDISVSVGAHLSIEGPPLHGSVTVEYWFISVTIPFGDTTVQIDYITDFGFFAGKYLIGGDVDNTCVGLRVTGGLLPPDPPGGQPAPGSVSQPWKITPEFSFASETRLPAHSWDDLLATGRTSPEVGMFDLAPMNKKAIDTRHAIRLTARGSETPIPVDAAHWEFNAVLGWVPDATWRWVNPESLQPAAGKLRAITGLEIVGKAVAVGQSALIPWATLVDDSIAYARPLPIAPDDTLNLELKQVGSAADMLRDLTAAATGAATNRLVERVLAGEATTGSDRLALGLVQPSAGPLALRSLRRERSSPPIVEPLSTGLTQKPVGLPAAPETVPAPPAEPLLLTAPRLRTLLQSRPQPVAATLAAAKTTVTGLAAAHAAPRFAPPRALDVAGARLVRVADPAAPTPTTAAVGTRTVSTPEIGMLTPLDHAAELDRLTAAVLGDGAEIAAGAAQLWELPGELAEAQVTVDGPGAVRVACIADTGELLHDVEGVAPTVTIPANADYVVVTGLGRAPDGLAPGPAGVTAHVAPPGELAATGWQTGGTVLLVSAARALCRGGAVALPSPFVPWRNGRRTTLTNVRLDAAMVSANGVETSLPIGTEVVLVLLEETEAEAAANGDIAIAAEGARLAAPPIPVFGGRRRALLYDVVAREEGREELVVSVASVAGWRLAGVVGLPGKAVEWANRFAGGVPEHVVPDGPLTPDGTARVRLTGTVLATIADTGAAGEGAPA